MPEPIDTKAKVVDLAAYRAYRQELAKRWAARDMPDMIYCRCILAPIPLGATQEERDA